jgi:hypothetical protein
MNRLLIAVVIVLIIVGVWYWKTHPYRFTSVPGGMDYIYGKPQVPGQGVPADGIYYIGTTASEAACQAAINKSGIPNLAYYTWSLPNGGSWANTCYARDNTLGSFVVAGTNDNAGGTISPLI